MGDLEDRTAWVTGGASGIGLATVARLAGEGARVGVLDMDEAGSVEVAARYDGDGANATSPTRGRSTPRPGCSWSASARPTFS
jgi:NAD(P)-dependent dehydrogenase (short-subunit alcohol dehydrogenase family)